MPSPGVAFHPRYPCRVEQDQPSEALPGQPQRNRKVSTSGTHRVNGGAPHPRPAHRFFTVIGLAGGIAAGALAFWQIASNHGTTHGPAAAPSPALVGASGVATVPAPYDPRPSSSPVERTGTILSLGAGTEYWLWQHPLLAGSGGNASYGVRYVQTPPASQAAPVYTRVVSSRDVVTSFRINLPAGSTLAQANAQVRLEVPSDASITEANDEAHCQITRMTSWILGQVMASTNPNGFLTLVYRSPTVDFDPEHISTVDLAATARLVSHC